MIVADASFLSPVVSDDGPIGEAARRELERDLDVAMPDLADVEVLSVLRRHSLAGSIPDARCNQAVADLAALPFPRYPASAFLERAFELRHTVSAYDAIYVALAEHLDATLVTMDGRLTRAPGIRCRVHLFQP